jgi:hypothetical protein
MDSVVQLKVCDNHKRYMLPQMSAIHVQKVRPVLPLHGKRIELDLYEEHNRETHSSLSLARGRLALTGRWQRRATVLG